MRYSSYRPISWLVLTSYGRNSCFVRAFHLKYVWTKQLDFFQFKILEHIFSTTSLWRSGTSRSSLNELPSCRQHFTWPCFEEGENDFRLVQGWCRRRGRIQESNHTCESQDNRNKNIKTKQVIWNIIRIAVLWIAKKVWSGTSKEGVSVTLCMIHEMSSWWRWKFWHPVRTELVVPHY